MSIYYVLIVLTCMIGLLFKQTSVIEMKNNKIVKKRTAIGAVFLLLIIWCLLFALRDSVGTDYSGYKRLYEAIENLSFSEFQSIQRDQLFGYVQYYCHQFTNGNWIVFQLVCSLLIYVPVLLIYKDESVSFTQTILIYIFTMCFFSGYNGTRQAIAASIMFFGYFRFLKKQKYIKYAIACALAFGFHSTVIFVIPFHFLSRYDIRSRINKIVISGLLVVYVFLWDLWPRIIALLEAVGQDKLAADYAEVFDDGASWIRLLVYVAPIIVAICFRSNLKEKYYENGEQICFLVYTAIFILFAQKYWIFARVASYFELMIPLFIPKLDCIFSGRSRRLGCGIILGLYFLYMSFLLLHGESHLYPYRFL